MQRISLSFFYGLGSVLRPIDGLAGGMKLNEVWATVYSAQSDLENLLATDWFAPAVKNAVSPGMALLEALKRLTSRDDFDEGEIGHSEVYTTKSALKEFETILRAELSNADAYYVTRKAGYESLLLVENAEQIFPSALGAKVPSAIGDIRAAGRCLAFELSTASGFHIFRAVETVLRVYWDAVASGLKQPDLQTIGSYAAELEKGNFGEVKTRETLKQMAKLHRNPLIHPEVSLDLEEAVGLFGICYSCIAAMLSEIGKPATPSALSFPAAAKHAANGA